MTPSLNFAEVAEPVVADDAQRGPRASVDLPGVDFATVAAAFGLRSARVGDDGALAEALRSFDDGGPALIEVAVDASQSSQQLRYRI